jgi:DNA-binding LacI/PurR family transcriptional regulator
MQVTLAEIAEITGFSVPTVSRVLSKSDYPVNSHTRQQIMEVAEAVGYKPNISARSLRTDRTHTVGIIVDDILSPFVPPIVRGIQDHLKDFDYLGLIINTDFNPVLEKDAINTLINRPVDGIIFVESLHSATSELLTQFNKPYVFVHRLFSSFVKNSVVPDDRYGAGLAVNHLVGLGHHRIAYINGPAGWHSATRRFKGYQEALLAQGLEFEPELAQPGDWGFEGGYKAAQNLLDIAEKPTAIFAANDLMALGAIYAIQDAGLTAPDDIAVVGYDNQEFTRIFRPKITTVSLPVYEMGKTAAELVIKQLREGLQNTDEIKIKGQLFVRESCGADKSQMTIDELDLGTTARRVVLNMHPTE